MKRFFALFLVVLYVLSLTACGADTDAESTGNETRDERYEAEMGNAGSKTDAADDETAGETHKESVADETLKDSSADPTAAYDSELRKLIPDTDVFPMNSGTWSEKDGYIALVVEGINSGNPTYDYIADLMAAGYSSSNSYGFDMYQANINYFNRQNKATNVKEQLCAVYCEATQMFAVVAGELPMRYVLWQLAGLTPEQIGDPYFEGELYDYIPKTSSCAIDLHYADMTGVNREQYQYQMSQVNQARAESLISFLEANGYQEVTREVTDGQSLYYEGQLQVYKGFEIYLTVQLGWSQEKLMVVFSEPGLALEKTQVFDGADSYQGDKTGRDPNAAPEDGYPVIDLSAAAVSETNGVTAYLLEDVPYVQSAEAYLEELKAQGYHSCDFYFRGYIPDMRTYYFYDDTTGQYNIYESLTNETEYIFINYYAGHLLVLKSSEMITWSEAELCSAVGMPYVPGEYYLRFRLLEIYTGIGQGYDTSGIAFNYSFGATEANYREIISAVKEQGFTNVLSEVQNGGYYEFRAWQNIPSPSTRPCLYVHVFLNGDHLEVQLSFSRDTQIMGG